LFGDVSGLQSPVEQDRIPKGRQAKKLLAAAGLHSPPPLHVPVGAARHFSDDVSGAYAEGGGSRCSSGLSSAIRACSASRSVEDIRSFQGRIEECPLSLLDGRTEARDTGAGFSVIVPERTLLMIFKLKAP